MELTEGVPKVLFDGGVAESGRSIEDWVEGVPKVFFEGGVAESGRSMENGVRTLRGFFADLLVEGVTVEVEPLFRFLAF